jgi:hypothetical protein
MMSETGMTAPTRGMEHEITGNGPLLDGRGRLREPGWARSLALDYDRGAIRAPSFRIKEWDYYCIVAGDIALAFTVADNSYMGLLSASVLDLERGGEVTETVMTALPMGRTGLPPSSVSGVTAASAKDLSMRFEASDGTRRLCVSWPSFGARSKGRAAALFGLPSGASATARGAVGLEAEIELRERPGRESMVIATPFKGHPRHFYYNQKINCQDATGKVRVGARGIGLEHGKAFGVLDWGRGVWPWRNDWLWGSASGLARVSGSASPLSFGFNIGYGFGDTSAASENMVFVDGRAHKIGRLGIDLDDRDFLKPWKVRSEDGRLELTLSPRLDRSAATDFLVLASIQHQVFGTWSGRVELEDGRIVEIEALPGFCEKVRNRW